MAKLKAQIGDAVEAAREFIRYYEDQMFASDQERIAKEATAGNVSAIEAIVDRLLTELERMKRNPGSF